MVPQNVALATQLVWLFVLAAAVACVTWTVAHEALFAGFHQWCLSRSRSCRHAYSRKFSRSKSQTQTDRRNETKKTGEENGFTVH